MEKRKTQAERRAETRQQVLDSACRLFGRNGYANTSLEEIASDCGLTTRPVYHYFGNKLALFQAVNDVMVSRILAIQHEPRSGNKATRFMAIWEAFLDLCDDPGFRQVVLIDSPTILGRERWKKSPVTARAESLLINQQEGEKEHYRQKLLSRMAIAAMAEAALMIADAEDIQLAKQEANAVVSSVLKKLVV
ncbi:TetR/AcrR family transcriptional regulator [Endozoicomonas atrinae]|uniref:TetR/AcrR family transcriptional regulator n=1 Tax=Endozoicomonas atrinae TaxID=1333660 RepID=UPI001EE6E07C|nr:TetR/AcrR family transcriptional regulator [Endozoicomonas atrinae]